MRKTILLVVMILGVCRLAHASDFVWDGNQLLEYCSNVLNDKVSDHPFREGVCLGYVTGIKDSIQTYQDRYVGRHIFNVCLPEDGVENGQATRVVVKYLNDHPERLHYHAQSLIIGALREAFPCKK